MFLVNQKMKKSAMIKGLYSEIDRLKQEVSAAREKNGIYIPRERYLQEEAEKKAMTEKIERLELDLESKDKQLIGLQELHSSQQKRSAELSEKLEKAQKKLEDTEHALFDLEERYRQANSTIKEKEFLISNLLKSAKYSAVPRSTTEQIPACPTFSITPPDLTTCSSAAVDGGATAPPAPSLDLRIRMIVCAWYSLRLHRQCPLRRPRLPQRLRRGRLPRPHPWSRELLGRVPITQMPSDPLISLFTQLPDVELPLSLQVMEMDDRRRPCFFKVFLPDLSSEFMTIPPAFWQHMESEPPHGVVSLKGPSGRVWCVDLVKDSRRQGFQGSLL